MTENFSNTEMCRGLNFIYNSKITKLSFTQNIIQLIIYGISKSFYSKKFLEFHYKTKQKFANYLNKFKIY